jgi:AcrR family transcriptional regulator
MASQKETSADGGLRLPPGISAAWGIGHGSRQGRRRDLSAAAIVEAGVRIAARDGLDGVSMARVAAELETAPMSLYRHVSGKDELLQLMVDEALGRAPEASAQDEAWRPAITRWAWALRTVIERHQWALDVPISGPPVTPNLVRWLESGLSCLAGTKLAGGERLSIMQLVFGFVRSEVATSAQLRTGRDARGGPEVLTGYVRLMMALLDAAEFPALTSALQSGALDRDDEAGEEFAFGLDTILDGVATLVGTRSKPSRRTGRAERGE